MLGFEPTGALPVGSGTPTGFTPPVAAPSQSEALAALRLFLLTVLPSNIPVVQAQDNRVPEPKGGDFLVLTPLRRDRLSTNQDTETDCVFTGSISGTSLTVSEVQTGVIALGSPVFGVGVMAGTKITALVDDRGGPGTYTVAPSQIVSERQMAAGTRTLEQHTEFTVQVDIHGPTSSDNAQLVSTVMRDAYSADWFGTNHPAVAPLYAGEPRQAPFLNDQKQYENRWTVEVHLQVNPVVVTPQQFAQELEARVFSVEAIHPARS